MSNTITSYKTQMNDVKSELLKFQEVANKTQSVKGSDLKGIESELNKIRDGLDPSDPDYGNVLRMIGDVQNLMGIADSNQGHGTAASNAAWAGQMNDVTELATAYADGRAPTVPTTGPMGTEVQASSLSGDAAKDTGKMYTLNSVPPMYVSDSGSGYSVYDNDGAKLKDVSYADAAKSTVDLGTNQFLKLSTKGFADGWISNSSEGTTAIASKISGSYGTNDGSNLNGIASGFGPGRAYKNMPETSTPLPGELATLQKTQQVNFLGDAVPPVYITSSNDKPYTYKMFDQAGQPMEPADLKQPFAIGMNNGSWYASSSDGVAHAWTTTDVASLSKDTNLYDLNGAANGKLVARGTNDGSGVPAAENKDSKPGEKTAGTASGNATTLDLKKAEEQDKLRGLAGKDTDFSKYLKDNLPSSYVKDGKGDINIVSTAEKLADAGVTVTQDKDSNTIVWDAKSKKGSAFDKDGKKIETPYQFQHSQKLTAPMTFQVGGMSVTLSNDKAEIKATSQSAGGAKIEALDLGNTDGRNKFKNTMGTDSDLTKFLKANNGKTGGDNNTWFATNSDGTTDKDGTVEALKKRDMQVFRADDGTTIIYDKASKIGGAFDKDGKSVLTPEPFWKRITEKKVDSPYEFTVSGMKATVTNDGIQVVKNG